MVQNFDTPEPYSPSYYLAADGSPQNTFAFNGDLTMSRAQAIAEAGGLAPGDRVLDYGCGLGAMTVAFSRLGYDAMGVDPSPHAIEYALPEARELVQPLTREVLASFANDQFDMVVAKDVFEHVPEDDLHDLTDRLLCIGKQVIAIIPTVGPDGKFILPLYENDPTHVTRLTASEWRGFFAYTEAVDCRDLTSKVRREDKVDGTICLRLAETDPVWQECIAWARTPEKTSGWLGKAKRLLGRAFFEV